MEQTLKYLSTPIPLNKIKHAVKVFFYRFTNLQKEDLDNKVEDVINNNIFNAVVQQKDTAQNAFVQANVEKYGRCDDFEEKNEKEHTVK